MVEERDGIFFYLSVLYSPTVANCVHVQRMQDQADNIELVKRAVELDPVLAADERHILSITYKNAVTSRRHALELIDRAIQHEIDALESPCRLDKLREFRGKVQLELATICHDLICLIDEALEPAAFVPDERVFYEHMKADCYRYICESDKEAADFPVHSANARACYDLALNLAQAALSPASPAYLGLVLNFSVFLRDIMQLQDDAIDMAETAWEVALDFGDREDDADHEERTAILQRLRDNCAGWRQS
jgi:14-3-3 protein epsilon